MPSCIMRSSADRWKKPRSKDFGASESFAKPVYGKNSSSSPVEYPFRPLLLSGNIIYWLYSGYFPITKAGADAPAGDTPPSTFAFFCKQGIPLQPAKPRSKKAAGLLLIIN